MFYNEPFLFRFPRIERRPVSNGYMSLQRPPSTGKITKLSGDDVRSEPDGGAYYTDYRKKDYRIPLTSVSSSEISCLNAGYLKNMPNHSINTNKNELYVWITSHFYSNSK